jgi:hypothetical protein
MKLTAQALIETIDKGDSNPAQRQRMIDELDELNDTTTHRWTLDVGDGSLLCSRSRSPPP